MNSIHKILAINEKELLNNVPDNASWHMDYADSPYIYVGNLHDKLQEHDIVVIFSQYGNPTHINLVRDKDSGKSRGFCYLKYEDSRSCVLAVDNFNGVLVYERPLRVDHTHYRLMPGQTEDDFAVEYPKTEVVAANEEPKLLEMDEFDDPMAAFEKVPKRERDRKRDRKRDSDSHRRKKSRSSHDKSSREKSHERRKPTETDSSHLLYH